MAATCRKLMVVKIGNSVDLESPATEVVACLETVDLERTALEIVGDLEMLEPLAAEQVHRSHDSETVDLKGTTPKDGRGLEWISSVTV